MQHLSSNIKATWPMLLILLLASIASSSLVVFSGITRGYWPYFLIWNLFLAWIPLGFAWFVRLRHLSTWSAATLTALWLLFFPNAPYLLTDLAHLRWFSHSGSWLTISIYITFALTGLFVGLMSLTWMHTEVRDRYGSLVGWLFVLLSLGASGFGVYIGRFLRFNSWDIFTDPLYVALVIKNQLFSPQTFIHAWGFSLTFALLTAFCYVMTQQMGQATLRSVAVSE
ncbi:MAG: DUF1361 domain-containing protein [Candidatus Promineifilaceae bacterium]